MLEVHGGRLSFQMLSDAFRLESWKNDPDLCVIWAAFCPSSPLTLADGISLAKTRRRKLDAPSSFLFLVASLFLVVRPGAPSSFLLLVASLFLLRVASLFLVVRPGAPSSVLDPSSKAGNP